MLSCSETEKTKSHKRALGSADTSGTQDSWKSRAHGVSDSTGHHQLHGPRAILRMAQPPTTIGPAFVVNAGPIFSNGRYRNSHYLCKGIIQADAREPSPDRVC